MLRIRSFAVLFLIVFLCFPLGAEIPLPDAILFGTLHRFREREGREEGAQHPAAVRFELELLGPEGAPLWRGSYDEAQRGLVDEPRSLLRARERGFRFVTAAALARYGARELVRALGAEPWR